MSGKNKSVQILLRTEIQLESELISHIESLGSRSGEAKRLILIGFREIKKNPLLYEEVEKAMTQLSKPSKPIEPSKPIKVTEPIEQINEVVESVKTSNSFDSLLKRR